MLTENDLIKTQKEYIELLIDEITVLSPLAHKHGWKSSRIDIANEYREKIQKLESIVNNKWTINVCNPLNELEYHKYNLKTIQNLLKDGYKLRGIPSVLCVCDEFDILIGSDDVIPILEKYSKINYDKIIQIENDIKVE